MQSLHLLQQQQLSARSRLTSARACAGQREGPLRRKIAEHRRTLPSPKTQACIFSALPRRSLPVEKIGHRPTRATLHTAHARLRLTSAPIGTMQAERDAAEGAGQKRIIVKLGGNSAKATGSTSGPAGEPAEPDTAAAAAAPAADDATASNAQTPATEAEPHTPAKAAQPAANQPVVPTADEQAPEPAAAPAEPQAADAKAATPDEGEPPKVLYIQNIWDICETWRTPDKQRVLATHAHVQHEP